MTLTELCKVMTSCSGYTLLFKVGQCLINKLVLLIHKCVNYRIVAFHVTSDHVLAPTCMSQNLFKMFIIPMQKYASFPFFSWHVFIFMFLQDQILINLHITSSPLYPRHVSMVNLISTNIEYQEGI